MIYQDERPQSARLDHPYVGFLFRCYSSPNIEGQRYTVG